jgi:hypothetical protein
MNKAKQRYFNKIYINAQIINCACGCGKQLKNKDKYGRNKSFINGHNNRIYQDPKQYKKEWRKRNKDKLYIKKVERGHILKRKIINLMNNKCSNCNLLYNNKNGAVFQLHHIEPTKKEITINIRTLLNYSWKTIMKELKKCKLLCANCHFLEHNSQY